MQRATGPAERSAPRRERAARASGPARWLAAGSLLCSAACAVQGHAFFAREGPRRWFSSMAECEREATALDPSHFDRVHHGYRCRRVLLGVVPLEAREWWGGDRMP
jgi:hypothetical protein